MAKILIVDDEKIALTMLESLLSKQGHQVTTATDAMGALEKVKARPFDLVITDARMPGSSGFELVKHLRHDPDLKKLKIILLTGLREKKDVERGIQAGVDGYLVKPIDPKVLHEKVEALLSAESAQVAPAVAVEIPLRETAKYVDALQVIGVSHEGLSFHAQQPFHPESQVQVDAAFFAEAGVKTPMLKILKCIPVSEGKYLVKTEFAGVDGDFKGKLLSWLEKRSAPKAA